MIYWILLLSLKLAVLPKELNMDMVFIEGGDFMMGSNTGEANEKPVHRVHVSGFYLGRTEVTVAQWQYFVTETGYVTEAERNHNGLVSEQHALKYAKDANWKNPYQKQDKNHPVVLISWNDATVFCEWLSRKTGRTYRLPTETEWEYACKSGSTGDYYGDLNEIAWYEYNSPPCTHPVGQKKPNAWGLYDMLGNVWELCGNNYTPDYNSVTSDLKAKGWKFWFHKVNRGGAWCSKPPRVRATFREHDPPNFCFHRLGFRVARSL